MSLSERGRQPSQSDQAISLTDAVAEPAADAAGAVFGKGRLGFGVQVSTDGTLSPTLKEVKISDVRPKGPADKAGLLAGDTVTQFAGQRIAGSSGDVFKKNLSSIKQGEHLKLVVLRAGKPVTINIVAGPDQ